MNWTIFVVLAALIVLVPTALYATFAATRDSYQYERHYGENGFTQEPRDDIAEVLNPPTSRTEEDADQAGYPLSEWPSDL